jgi:hypothetical protein
LSHTSTPFCFGYFRERVWCFAQASLDHNPILSFLQSLGQQVHATTPIFFSTEMGFRKLFCLGWP